MGFIFQYIPGVLIPLVLIAFKGAFEIVARNIFVNLGYQKHCAMTESELPPPAFMVWFFCIFAM